jgi:3-oxoacyl-(acyl-carrier-protein) synthase III
VLTRGSSETAQPAILGIGTYRPHRVVDNAEICRRLDSTPEWIVQRSGIETRRFAGPDETLAHMAATAVGKALADAGCTPNSVDRIVVATMSDVSGDAGLAGEIALRIGAHPAALQISAACSGFCVALALAADLVRFGEAEVAVVVGVERMSDVIDPEDRGTAFIFGDGAGAVVVGRAAENGIGPVVWGSYPDLVEAITVRPRPGVCDGRPVMRMAGSQVFRWAVTEMPAVVGRALGAAGITADALDAFVPHQANLRIIKQLAAKAGLPPKVEIASDIVTAGNTSAASIPLALDALRAAERIGSGSLALLVGFGAGLEYAAQVVRVP